MVSCPVRTKERIKVSPHFPHPATQYGKPFTVHERMSAFSRLEIEKKNLSFSRLWRLPPSQTCSVPLQPMQHDLFHKRATVSLFSLAVDEVFSSSPLLTHSSTMCVCVMCTPLSSPSILPPCEINENRVKSPHLIRVSICTQKFSQFKTLTKHPQFSTSLGKATSSGQNGKYSATKNQLPQPKVILFARENVKVGWNSLGRNWSAGCGFNNVGNTCYLNSTLQAFFHVPALAHWLLSDLREHGKSCNSNGKLIAILKIREFSSSFSSSSHFRLPALHHMRDGHDAQQLTAADTINNTFTHNK